jgi:two-component system response regulator PilR (NtrC family)
MNNPINERDSGPKILLVDDDPKFQKLILRVLEKHGFEVTVCNDGIEAKEIIDESAAELVISDYKMPNMDGVELLKALREDGRDIPFILITAYGSIDSTMAAIKLGTVEYLTKPFDPEEIVLAAQKALNMGHVNRELSQLREAVQAKYSFDNLIGQSPSMQDVYRNIHKASQTSTNVLISGETGTGKELAARAIHYNGLLKEGPFIAVNCSAFSGGTLESELFGHDKGAFTNAYRDHKGRFELADQGTLFLDEGSDIPLSIQVKLLRVLQEKRFERVGGQETLYSDFRLIAATNKNLKDRVKKGLFREDLFYRLSVVNITMPRLKEHPEDIPLLTKHYLKIFSRINKKDIKTLSLEAMKLMQSYSWPGNVRQLENAIESAVAMCDGNMIKVADLPLEMTDLASEKTSDSNEYQGSLPRAVAAVERKMIRQALDQNEWVKARAAKVLGISERVLSYKMGKYGFAK